MNVPRRRIYFAFPEPNNRVKCLSGNLRFVGVCFCTVHNHLSLHKLMSDLTLDWVLDLDVL
jgi:hypothetical protein